MKQIHMRNNRESVLKWMAGVLAEYENTVSRHKDICTVLRLLDLCAQLSGAVTKPGGHLACRETREGGG